MNRSDKNSAVLVFMIGELLDMVLRPLWLSDLSAFTAKLDATNCYPFRVCYVLGVERKQLWFEAPGEQSNEEDES